MAENKETGEGEKQEKPKRTRGSRSKLLPLTIIIVVFFLVLLGVVVWIAARKPFIVKQVIETNVSTVVREILPVSEYVSLIYNYQTVSQRTFNQGSWISANNLLFVLEGTIKLGFDSSKIEVEERGVSVILKMPPIKIISHEQYPERATTYELRERGIFPVRVSPQDVFDLLGDTKSEIENQVEGNLEIILQARNSAKELFEPLLKMNPALRDQYAIIFQW